MSSASSATSRRPAPAVTGASRTSRIVVRSRIRSPYPSPSNRIDDSRSRT
ncbi:hypothetical protein [Azospirillum argentinense]|nr:hypothetical protein [Azospirillum argentinense]